MSQHELEDLPEDLLELDLEDLMRIPVRSAQENRQEREQKPKPTEKTAVPDDDMIIDFTDLPLSALMAIPVVIETDEEEAEPEEEVQVAQAPLSSGSQFILFENEDPAGEVVQVSGLETTLPDDDREDETGDAAGLLPEVPGHSGPEAGAGQGGSGGTGGGTGNVVVTGTNGPDSIMGSDESEDIHGLNGADTIYGMGGDDRLYGGNGPDVLDGGDGDDELYGGNGPDELYGGAGDDELYGGNGPDELYGGEGNDYLEGGSGPDELHGGGGDDEIVFVNNDRLLDGGTGFDTLVVESGDLDLSGPGSQAGKISGIEAIDLEQDSGANEVVLSAEDLLDISDSGVLQIFGDSNDQVTLTGDWSYDGSSGQHIYTSIDYPTAQVTVDDQTTVIYG